MAGHSQFKNIMHRKGRQDAVKSKMFSKLAREITVAAKMGMPDPAMNPRLRLAIQNAKAESMPKDNIQRAINKAAGGDAENYDEVRYEGYGPGGVAAHRRGADRQPQPLRLERARRLHQGRRGAGRNRLGVVHVGPRRRDLLPSQGRRRRQGHGGGDRGRRRRRPVRRGRPHDPTARFESRRRGVEGAGSALGEAEVGEVIWKPQNNVPVDEERAQSLMKLVATLEDDDDVQNVYANFEVDDATLAKLSAA